MSLIMKRLSLAVSVLLICLGAGAQNISLSFSGASLSDVLHAIEEQTDCSFIYETADLNKASSITIEAKTIDIRALFENASLKRVDAFLGSSCRPVSTITRSVER